MSLEWIAGIGVTVIVGLAGVIWRTLIERIKKLEKKVEAASVLETRIVWCEKEIGQSSKDGLRGDRHRSNNLLSRYKAVIMMVMKHVGVNGEIMTLLDRE